jgi:hypothetical protein
VGDQAPDPTPALVHQLRLAARSFAAGLDGLSLLPAELRAPVVLWRERLQSAGEVLDSEAWALGLLTLVRVVQRESLPDACSLGTRGTAAELAGEQAEHWAGVAPAKRIG